MPAAVLWPFLNSSLARSEREATCGVTATEVNRRNCVRHPSCYCACQGLESVGRLYRNLRRIACERTECHVKAMPTASVKEVKVNWACA